MVFLILFVPFNYSTGVFRLAFAAFNRTLLELYYGEYKGKETYFVHQAATKPDSHNRNPASFIKYENVQVMDEFFENVQKMQSLESKTTWHVNIFISHIGRTSFVSTHQLRDTPHGPLLAEWNILHVRVNLETRKPSPLPRELMEKRSSLVSPKPLLLSEFAVPPGEPVSSYQFQVLHSWIDVNGHVNKNVYIWLVLKCLSAAIEGGFLRKGKCLQIGGDNCLMVKSVATMNEAESFLGQILQVHLWLCPENSELWCVHGVVSCSGKTLVRSRIVLYNDAYLKRPLSANL